MPDTPHPQPTGHQEAEALTDGQLESIKDRRDTLRRKLRADASEPEYNTAAARRINAAAHYNLLALIGDGDALQAQISRLRSELATALQERDEAEEKFQASAAAARRLDSEVRDLRVERDLVLRESAHQGQQLTMKIVAQDKQLAQLWTLISQIYATVDDGEAPRIIRRWARKEGLPIPDYDPATPPTPTEE
ncbi:hypothetical protein LJ737_20835 [Hymenobacter sp. 15J16-1T3B]|uniref:hypothetical protein n=1 Tax=Hymenobacter sp. 15J16-1T3B TaxID=2886941 RepID=UPI001D12E8CC|nr:hypothetical protein [Hymenobacter sp. 15J16-1T3B]MCC3159700.1 hypothetical protein [Hymenobacter sp. 15J16-1T3B]